MTTQDQINNEESVFLRKYSSSDFEKPSVAVDLLVFTIEDGELKIVLVKRSEHPYKGCLSLPGVFVGIDETLDNAAKRAASEEAGLENIYFEQLYTWGGLDRDPRMRIISVSYLSLINIDKLHLSAGKRTDSVGLYPVDKLLKGELPAEIAFDHRQMIEYGRDRIRNKTEYTRIAFEFLPKEFTLPQLQRVYEILLGKPLYKANFRRKLMPMIEETDRMTSGDAHRPSKFYREKTGIRRTDNE